MENRKSCELFDTCKFLLAYKGGSLVQLEGWMKEYCSNLEASEKCIRKKLHKETGQPVANNITPTGELLQSTLP